MPTRLTTGQIISEVAPPLVESRPVLTRRRVLIAVGAVLAALLVTSIWVRAVHPRDEADFLLAVQGDPSTGLASVLPNLEDDDIVAEGDFACRWLDQQDRALWNHGRWWNRDDVLDRYIEQTRPVIPGVWGAPSVWPVTRYEVADAAWSQLCGGTWWWHRPHGPAGSGGGIGGGGGGGGD